MIEYSPSETVDFLTCPTYRAYRWPADGEGQWVQREMGQPEFAALVGTGVHKGLAVWWHGRALPIPTSQVFQAGADALTGALQHAEDAGRVWVGVEPPSEALVVAALTRYLEWERTTRLGDAIVMGVERRIGHAKLDLILRSVSVDEDDRTQLTVVDWKGIFLRDLMYLADRIRAWHTSWQFRDYVWRATQLCPPADTVRTLLVVGFIWLWDKKRKVWEIHSIIAEPVAVSPGELIRWETDAVRVWDEMEKDHLPVRNLTRCANLGYNRPCEFYEFCWGAGINTVTHIQMPKRNQKAVEPVISA